ncbi:MAG: hypothetical protein IM638_19045 [Bacteroidetes bacterium]|nr:hypothetical protein [Bacteroidota bacterium]
MLFRKFVFTTLILVLAGAALYLFGGVQLDIVSHDTYYAVDLAQLFFSAAISMIPSSLLLLYIELIQKKSAPQKLTQISYLLHLAGILVLLTTIAASFAFGEREYLMLTTIFVYTGLFLAVAGMSLIPAILLIAMRKK